MFRWDWGRSQETGNLSKLPYYLTLYKKTTEQGVLKLKNAEFNVLKIHENQFYIHKNPRNYWGQISEEFVTRIKEKKWE